ncbi:serine/threonine protein kinase [Sediminibacillus albus]|uniref:Serine/threonine protein kinase n=1 Tax=Sediminibacillus albus TaxID=407036 RepID=A0A1G9B9Z6_9BACI|nr:serine/threonine protein kinase [Sediminibacillus albus]SDK35860.1 hypothetical protein SAMN05216243_2876 [Sediminibacillus albus]
MREKWEPAIKSLTEIEVVANGDNELVLINGQSDGLICIGIGTDAAVFRHIETPDVAFKLYAREKVSKRDQERLVYRMLGNNRFFPACYGTGDRFIVLSYEQGTTLYDCLLQGLHIPESVIKDVDEARAYVRSIGLNPRDIHLKNVLLQNGRAKIIDVSEYINPGDDCRWEHLKRGYHEYYHLIDGKPIPFWLVDTIRKWYNQWNGQTFIFEEFMKKVTRLTMFWR